MLLILCCSCRCRCFKSNLRQWLKCHGAESSVQVLLASLPRDVVLVVLPRLCTNSQSDNNDPAFSPGLSNIVLLANKPLPWPFRETGAMLPIWLLAIEGIALLGLLFTIGFFVLVWPASAVNPLSPECKIVEVSGGRPSSVVVVEDQSTEASSWEVG